MPIVLPLGACLDNVETLPMFPGDLGQPSSVAHAMHGSSFAVEDGGDTSTAPSATDVAHKDSESQDWSQTNCVSIIKTHHSATRVTRVFSQILNST